MNSLDIKHKPESLHFVSAKGCCMTDENGGEYISLNEISCNLGYNHPKFIAGLHRCADQCEIGHVAGKHQEKERLLGRLMEYSQGDFQKGYIAGIGGEVVDYAVKIARRYTGKEEIVSFWKSLHGRSYVGAALSGLPLRKHGFGIPMGGILTVPYADCKGCDFNCGGAGEQLPCIEHIRKTLKYASTGSLAAIIIEPVQAMGGMVYPPADYMRQLKEIAHENNALLVFDEIQCGMGRCGSMYAYQQMGVAPDILLLGKGLSNGLSFAAMLMTEQVAACIGPMEVSGGCSDNEYACGVMNNVLDIMEEEQLIEQVKEKGQYFLTLLQQQLKSCNFVKSIHGKGLAIGIRLAGKNIKDIAERLKKNGILIAVAEDHLVIRPAFVITREQIEKSVAAIAEVLTTEEVQ